ncbi:hypothetical protein HY989_02345 [Candidatus Micrarchaeota archaeon]|nr:hypothetical protein [Candidatus Micrarchaeota archaeon]
MTEASYILGGAILLSTILLIFYKKEKFVRQKDRGKILTIASMVSGFFTSGALLIQFLFQVFGGTFFSSPMPTEYWAVVLVGSILFFIICSLDLYQFVTGDVDNDEKE